MHVDGRATLDVLCLRGRVETPTTARRRDLADHVRCAFIHSRKTYGCRRTTAAPNRDDVEVSAGTVADIMRELGLRAIQSRAYKRTTVAGDGPVVSPDLIERDFTAPEPGQRFVGDITYLRTGQGWLYLATVLDLATRMVVGWQAADHMRTSLVVDALTMAMRGGYVSPGAVFHSDRGRHYTSTGFAVFARKNAIRTSVGRTGVCWDNAAAESWFATLKNEMYYQQSFPTRSHCHPPLLQRIAEQTETDWAEVGTQPAPVFLQPSRPESFPLIQADNALLYADPQQTDFIAVAVARSAMN